MSIFKWLPFFLVFLAASAVWIFSKKQFEEIAQVPVVTAEKLELLNFGSQVPRYIVRTLEGKKIDITKMRGQPILINFWASWCPPCIEELPSLLKFSKIAKARWNLVTIAISVDEQAKNTRRALSFQKHNSSNILPMIGIDTQENVMQIFGVEKYPETFLYNGDFQLIRKFVGPYDWTSTEMLSWFNGILKNK